MKITHVLEITIVLVISIIINFIWFKDNPGYLGLHPHPFLFIVLAAAIRYGFKTGIAAASLSFLFYFIFLFTAGTISDVLSFLKYEYFSPVLLFFLTGGIVGHIRSNQVKKYNLLLESKKHKSEEVNSLQQRLDEIEKMNQELSKRIVSKKDSISTLYEMVKRINVLNTNSIIPSTLNFISDILEVDKCSFYKYKNGELKFDSQIGWQEGDENQIELIPYNELVLLALNTKRPAVISDLNYHGSFVSPRSMNGSVIISVPVLIGKQKEIFGILNIEKISFLRLNSDSVHLLTIIADWMSYSLSMYSEISSSGKISQKQTTRIRKQLEKYLQNKTKQGVLFSEMQMN